MSSPAFAALDAAGLNLQAVFDVATLPADVRAGLPRTAPRQLILVGHAGSGFWRALLQSNTTGAHPMDDFSRHVVTAWLAGLTDMADVHWLYPGETAVGLQRLGQLAGWHHDSPFKVGVHPGWGSWFAYRAAVLADTHLPVTPRAELLASPCRTCEGTPCVSACPARAMDGDGFSLPACLAHRTRPDSSCATTCLARLACPVGTQFRYPPDQIEHMYGHSLTMIRAHLKQTGET